jgi:glycosyltransferase involved in cell wall biosynthesis
MRVAIVNDVAGVGRLEQRALREAGVEADFFDVPRPGARWPFWAKALVGPVRLMASIPLIARLHEYDLVHVHFVSQGFLGALSGRPYVLHAHGSDLHANLRRPLLRAWSRMWMRRARGIFYVTPNLAGFLRDFAEKAVLLPNPVDLDRFAHIEPPSAVARGLLFMRLEAIKGPDVVFDAVSEVARHLKLSAVSWGPLAESYRDRYGDVVEFIDPVPHDQVPDMLSRTDVVVGQLRQGAMGLSELEALAAARVVLMRLDATDDPPPVINVSSGDEILSAIVRLQNEPDEVSRIARSGREWVRAHNGLSVHADALNAAYAKAMRR